MAELEANFTLNNEDNIDALFEIYATGTTWGNIDGSIENQTDLYNTLTDLAGGIESNHQAIGEINTTIGGYGDIVTFSASDFATSTQGQLADTALQPNDNISELNNDVGYITSASLPTVNNATITIQKNGSTIESFTLNQSNNETVNITVPTSASDIGALPSSTTIEDLTTTAQLNALNSGATSTNIGQIATNTSAISTINGKIPSQASTSNQLADKNFVNSSIATNTANFIGTFNSVAELEAYSGTLTNNDYAFVETTDTAGNTLYDRYKYTTATNPASWQFEYELNNSSFTSNQWAAINSGVTSNDVTLINTALQPNDNITELVNNAGYITGIDSTDVTTALGYTPVNPSSLATVATSGLYSDLTGTPTIPTVNNATLTINQGGTTKGTFTANASSDVTIDIDAGGGGTWGSITGTLSDQTDLQNALNAKQNTLINGDNIYFTTTKGLPASYTEITSITNADSTYVDTGVRLTTDNAIMEIRCVISSTAKSFYLWQQRSSSSGNILGISGNQSGDTITMNVGGTAITSDIARTDGHTYFIRATYNSGNGTLYVKDETTGTEATNTGTYTWGLVNKNLFMFGNGINASQTCDAGITVNFARLTVNGTKTFEACFAKNSSNTVGIYDTVNRAFRTAGIGSLTAGADSDKPKDVIYAAGFLKNTATGSNTITIGGVSSGNTSALNVGGNSSTGSAYTVALGNSAKATGQNSTAVGQLAEATGNNGVAVGRQAKATANYAVQLGTGTNASADTFSVGLQSGNFTMLYGATGKVPNARLNALVGADGTNAGTAGIVPAPIATDNTKFLRGDGTWATAGGGTVDQTYDATSTNAQSGTAVAEAISTKQDTLTFSTGLTDTSGTITVTNYAKLLKNTATRDQSLTINGNASTQNQSINIGMNSTVSSNLCVAVGFDAQATKSSAVTVGYGGRATGTGSSAYGYFAKATANYAIQLGNGTNSTSYSLAVGFNNTNYQLLDGTTGKIPNARLNTLVGADGTNAGTAGIVPAPTATDNAKFLKGDGTWANVDSLPTQTGNSGKFLTTDGTDASWADVPYRNIGEIVASTIPLIDAGLHLLDGALISGSGIYADFVDYISNLDLMANYFCTEAEWQQSVTDYGVCGKFVYDSVSNTVRLPKITGIVEGTTDVTALGDLVEAGLPNIEGTMTSSGWKLGSPTLTGAFYREDTGGDRPTYGTSGGSDWYFDASRSNPIYGNSTTVQPQTIKAFYYIVVATTTKTNIQVDIDEIATDLNGKVDISDLAEVQCVVETYVNGTSWYRVYSDGWCEQGGEVSKAYNNTAQSVSLLKQYVNTNYNVLFSLGGNVNSGVAQASWRNKTTSSFELYGDYSSDSGTIPTYWQASGYIGV